MTWRPEDFKRKRHFLEKRMEIIRAVRAYFDGQDFLEVETPILQVSPVMDAHIHAFQTTLKGIDLKPERELYLHTSPEFAMKKLMAGGANKLYQVCHVFRNAEGSRLHSPEFTLLEWYRAPGDYTDMMEDTIGLLRHCAKTLGISHYRKGEHSADPFAEWERLSVAQAFERYAGIELDRYLEDRDGLLAAVKALGIHTAEDDRWDDLFFRVMMEKIEPYLGYGVPTILYDYPVMLASLSRKKHDDPRYAERFEVYVCGVELCNAFSELTDAKEQRARFQKEMQAKQALYGECYPLDEDFIKALEYGLPESGGNALGVDRLVMLATNATHIEEVLWLTV